MKNIKQNIKKSMNLLKDDIAYLLKPDIDYKRNYFLREPNLQSRLYYHLCNIFKDEFYNIYLEHNPHMKYNKLEYHKSWKECLRKYYSNFNKKDFENHVWDKKLAKKGNYDISIFKMEKEIYKFYHAIELKIIKSCNSDLHKGYEDLYVLTDLIKNNVDCFQNVETYFFTYVFFNSNTNMKLDKMKDFIRNVKETHEKAKVNFDYFIYDNTTDESYLL